MTEIICCKCGIAFSVPSEWDRQKRLKHDTFYCPNGHGQSYVGKTDAEKYKELADNRLEEIETLQKREMNFDTMITFK